MSLLKKAFDRKGQMTVELCVVFPVAIAIAVIATNALSFFGYCAEFDRLSRNMVRIHACSPEYGQNTGHTLAMIKEGLQEEFSEQNLDLTVAVEKDYKGLEHYRMAIMFRPTLFGMGLKSEIFGVRMPMLVHESRFTIDPYKPGMLF